MKKQALTPLLADRSTAQRGVTLVELMVALALGLLVVLAAGAALVVSRQGFRTVDAASQLRDDGRFAASIIQRIVVQGGYLDFKYASTRAASAFRVGGPDVTLVEPNIKGFNNATYSTSNSGLLDGTSNTPSGTSLNSSDLLIVRFQPGSVTKADGSERTDLSMIDCGGNQLSTVSTEANMRIVSAFYVAPDPVGAEPSLMCAWKDPATNTWQTQTLVKGVETLQVLYGVDGVTANAVPTAAADSVPEQYMRADQLVVASNVAATNDNWARVRSLRIGLVLRGPIRSAQDLAVPAQYPLGAVGVMNSSSDPGSVFPAQTDGRLRQTVTFTIHLRNIQDTI